MSDFLFITHDNHDPYFNLASEEYLLRHKDGFYIYLWVNSPAVIVGINQNTIQEVNLGFTEANGIKVVRRQTGGGAVYHDLNNICYTVIAPYDESADNYRKFTAPVIEYLNSLGVKAEFSGRNDITAEGKKISYVPINENTLDENDYTTEDGTHPLHTGDRKFAQVWYAHTVNDLLRMNDEAVGEADSTAIAVESVTLDQTAISLPRRRQKTLRATVAPSAATPMASSSVLYCTSPTWAT